MWTTPNGLTATIVEHPDADTVGIRLTEGDTHVETLPIHATYDEAVDYCNAVYVAA